MKTWRILQLVSTSDMGGTERMVLFLIENMDRQRFEVSVASLLGSGELLTRATPFVQEARHFHYRFPVDPATFLSLARFIRRNRIDLVHTYGLRADVVGRLAAKAGGAKAIVSSIRSIDPWRNKFHTMLDRATAGKVDLFIANSSAGKDATVAREKFSPDRIEVIRGGVPEREIPREEKENIRAQYGLNSLMFPIVLVLANLRDMKGHNEIIRAITPVRAKFPHVKFLFAGRDDSAGAIEKMAYEKGVVSSIGFLGYVRQTERLLAIADIFLLASKWEGLPASIIEAMHAKVPVIATRVGGIPELIRDGEDGLLIPASNHLAISEAVLKLANDASLRQRLATSAYNRAQAEFSIEQMVQRTEAAYTRLLESTPTSD
jgi:glycosyltransferase involved in cell wall biosynthesis